MISFITINYNGVALTRVLLRSLHSIVHSVEYEVVVVDNGSTEDEATMLQAEFPWATVVATGRNLGFAGGNNEGIKVARGEWLLLINNDTYIEEDNLHLLVQYMQQHPQVGAITPLLCYDVQPRQVQWAGYTPLTTITLRNSALGQGTEPALYTEPCTVPYCHGAAMMVRREAIDKAGLMPTVFFLYYEEVDWCCRLSEAGYTMAFVPWQRVVHCESRTTRQGSPFQTYYLTRGRLLFARRNRKGAVRLAALLYQLLAVLPRNVITNLLKPAVMMAHLRGTMHGLLDNSNNT